MEVDPMRLPDGTILMESIEHRAVYDPAKAREYYLRTRKLKGRQPMQGRPPTRSGSLGVGSGPSTYTVKLDDGTSMRLTKEQLVEQKAYAAKRVKEIKQNLEQLGAVLKRSMAKAKKEKAEAAKEAAKPDTASEKSAAARDSKQYRDKHSESIATKARTVAKTVDKKVTAKADPVAELESTITQIKDTLRAAVANQRALAGATQNR